MARNKPARSLGFVIPPEDVRPRGPLTSDDRGWGNDVTRGGDIECSGVLGDKGGREIGIRTVNAREMPCNPYGVGSHGENNDEHQEAK
jgi:hypothetical protein